MYSKVKDTTNTTIGKVNGGRQYFSKCAQTKGRDMHGCEHRLITQKCDVFNHPWYETETTTELGDTTVVYEHLPLQAIFINFQQAFMLPTDCKVP